MSGFIAVSVTNVAFSSFLEELDWVDGCVIGNRVSEKALKPGTDKVKKFKPVLLSMGRVLAPFRNGGGG